MADPKKAVTEAEDVAKDAWEKEQLKAALQGMPAHQRPLVSDPLTARRTWQVWHTARGQGIAQGPTTASPTELSLATLAQRLARNEGLLAQLKAEPVTEERLASLGRAVADLARQVDELAGESITPAELSVLPGLKLRRPIPIVVEESGEDVLARWVEPGITGIGESEGEAVESLAEIIVDVWHELSADGVKLSGNTRRMLAVIESYAAPSP